MWYCLHSLRVLIVMGYYANEAKYTAQCEGSCHDPAFPGTNKVATRMVVGHTFILKIDSR